MMLLLGWPQVGLVGPPLRLEMGVDEGCDPVASFAEIGLGDRPPVASRSSHRRRHLGQRTHPLLGREAGERWRGDTAFDATVTCTGQVGLQGSTAPGGWPMNSIWIITALFATTQLPDSARGLQGRNGRSVLG